jgi:hypothetical protein
VLGDTVLLQNQDGSMRVEATVTDLADPYPSVAASKRGYRMVGVHVSFTNVGSAPFTIRPDGISLQDDAGLYTFDALQFGQSQLRSAPDRFERSKLDPGKSVAGWLLYELTADAKAGSLIYLGTDDGEPRAWLLARFDIAAGMAARPTRILNRSAIEVGTIKIEQIITQFERTDPSIAPLRGARAVSLVLSVHNTGNAVLNLDGSFLLIDQFGTYYQRYYYDRSTTSRAAYPELKIRIRPGQTERGIITFELPMDSSIAMVMVLPSQGQFFILGGAYDSVTVTPDAYAGSADDEEWGTEIPGCEGIREWAEGSNATMMMANEVVEGIKDDIDTATPGSIRNAAASLRHTAQLQEAVVPPTKAHEAQLDLINLLRTAADMLDDMADRIESGESPETVADMMDAPGSPYMLAGKDAIFSALAVLIACPIE